MRLDLPAKPWLAVQALGVVMMLHAAVIFALVGDDPVLNREILGWMFLSIGICGLLVSFSARRWLGSPTIGWSGGVVFFGSVFLLTVAPPGNLVLSLAVALVVFCVGLTHWAGAVRLRREEQRYRPYVCSGAVNIFVSLLVLQNSETPSTFTLCALVAGATFTSGITLYHYGRLLRRLATTGASMMVQVQQAAVTRVRHSKVRI